MIGPGRGADPDPGTGRRRGVASATAALLLGLGSAGAQEPALAPVPAVAPAGRPAPAPFIPGLKASASAVQVKVGQGKILTLPVDLNAVGQKNAPFLAVGDPDVLDFYQIDSRHLRLIGKKLGMTDLTFSVGSGDALRTYEYEVQVTADLDELRARLRQSFPDAVLELAQLREKIVVEGQARDANQVSRIVQAIEGYIRSVQRVSIAGRVADRVEKAQAPEVVGVPLPPLPAGMEPGSDASGGTGGSGVLGGVGGLGPGGGATSVSTTQPGLFVVGQTVTNQTQVLNLLRVPTTQQVLLKVRVAELNRTGLRQIGADVLASIPQFRSLFGTQITGKTGFTGALGSSTFGNPRDISFAASPPTPGVYGTFSNGQFNTFLTVLRANSLLKILAEPNLVAMNGYQANFLAGGEFPVPSFSGIGGGSSTGGGASSSTQFKKYGVSVSFLPIILDGETIRLMVEPEVSQVDFTTATTLVPGGSPVPGLITRNAHTTVELKQGETLAIAGLMQLQLEGNTQRIPGLGDLPYIGEFFSNTTSNRIEKELIVLVTPYLVEPMAPGQVPPGPGDEVNQPNDLEFFFLNRIEGRTGIDARSTTSYDDPFHLIRHSILERSHLIGPSGFSK